VRVEVVSEGGETPPVGAPLVVQVLDTTYADAPARVVAEATANVEHDRAGEAQTVELEADLGGNADYRVRAHVDVDGDGAVGPGDFVTTAAHPARAGEPVRVVVKKV
jgi:uncharacterized lipoprotein YbaY